MSFFNSFQQEANQQMVRALQSQLQTTTCPTARKQIMDQINQLNSSSILTTIPQAAPASPKPDISNITFELSNIKNSIAKIEAALKNFQ